MRLMGQAPTGPGSEQRARRLEEVRYQVNQHEHRYAKPGLSQVTVGIDFFGKFGRFSGSSISSAIRLACLLLCPLSCQPAPPGSLETVPLSTLSRLRIGTSGDYAPFSTMSAAAHHDPPADSHERPEDDPWDHPRDLPQETGPVRGPSGSPEGFSIEVARAYGRDRGVALEWLLFRWPELAGDLQAERFDLALSGITVRPDRSMIGRFSLPLTTSGAIVLVRDESRYSAAADLDHAATRIAVNAGGHLEAVTRRLFPNARIRTVADNASVPDELSAGRADAIVTDSLEAPHWQAAHPGLRAIGPLTRDRKAGWFPIARAIEAKRFDDWLLAAEASGRLGALRRRFGLPAERTADPMPALLASLDERLSLMHAVAESKRVLGIPIEDLARERHVLDAANRAVVRAAVARRTPPPDPQAVRRLFHAQIEAAKWIQRDDLARDATRQDENARRAAMRARLDETIRPALLYLGERIAKLVVVIQDRAVAAPGEAEVARALARHELPEDHLRALADALRGLVTQAAEPGEPPPRPGPAAANTAPNA